VFLIKHNAMKAILATLLVSFAAIAFGADKSQAPPILGHLETQDRVVTLWAGPQPCYTVRTKDGKMLADKISASELRACYPELARINDATTVAWAGL
jgi:hypothetical protein